MWGKIYKIDKHVEKNVVMFTALFVSILTFIGGILSIISKLNLQLSIFILIISIFYIFHFIYIKIWNLNKIIKYSITIFSIIFQNFIWYNNYWSIGPSLLNFFFLNVFILFIWDFKHIVAFTIVIYLNLISLMLYELNHIELMPSYISEPVRIIAVYLGLAIILLVNLIYTLYLKNNYVKQYQMALKSDQLKSAFLANFSHEIRTPLNSIIGFSDLITFEDIEPKEKEKYNQIIQNNSNDLLMLIEDIVDLSMIESSELKLVQSSFNIDTFMESLFQEYIPKSLDLKNIELIYNKNNSGIILHTDLLRLKQILRNLLDNALKYTEKGEIKFGYTHSIKKNKITFYVNDTGIGIKGKDIELIFERFMKIENKTEVYRGVGVGLHLSKRIAEFLGGNIRVESTFGKGSTFFLSLPVTLKNHSN